MLCTRVVTTQEGFEKALKDKVDEIWLKGSYAEELIKKYDIETKERKTSDGKHWGVMLGACAATFLLPGIAVLPALGVEMAAAARLLEIGEPLKYYELVACEKGALLLKRKTKKVKEKK